MDYRAIARSITDPENQPHQWSDEDLAQFFVSAADKIEELKSAIGRLQYKWAEATDARDRERARADIALEFIRMATKDVELG